MARRKHILFIAYGGGHIKMLIPVILNFLNNSSYIVTVIGLTTAGTVLRENNIPFVSYKDFSHLIDNERCLRFGRLLVGDKSDSSLVPYEESVAYHGINFVELIDSQGEELAYAQYQKKGRQCFLPVLFFSRLLENLKPDLVVATNSPRSERAAVEAAGMLGIRSICLVDMFALQEVDWIGKQNFAQKICVLNDSVKNMFINHGRRPNEIVVTGNPAFDQINHPSVLKESLNTRAKHKVSPSLKIILYASQPEPAKHPFSDLVGDPTLPMKIEVVLRKFVEAEKEFHLIIRYHPSENTSFVPQERVSFSSKTEALHPVIHASDVVVVTASTVGLEAYLAKKPVISVDSSIFFLDAPFSTMGISKGVKSEEELPDKIKELTLVESNSKINPSVFTTATHAVSKVIIDSLGEL